MWHVAIKFNFSNKNLQKRHFHDIFTKIGYNLVNLLNIALEKKGTFCIQVPCLAKVGSFL